MKKFLLLLMATACWCLVATAQCTAGYTNCSLNWDYLQFFPSAGITGYTTLANSQTQRFAFGTQKLTLTHNYTGSNATGTSTANTAETGSNGAGADVYFWGNGTITVTFQTGVQNVRFSIYDIDASQRITIASAGNIVTVSEIGTNSHLSNTGSGTATAIVNSSSSTQTNSSTLGTINVAITSALPPTTSITSFTITASNSGASNAEFYLSDISACSPGAFTSNYFQVSKPFTNQPGYIVTSRNDSFYFVNPANGASKFIFRDSTGLYANSVAYDPVRHEIYYAFSLTLAGPAIDPNNKTLRRYNYDKDTFGVVIPDVTAFAPVFEQGIESGAAAFYDGSLYLGIEASASGTNESTVWKIEFNGSGVPTTSSQVYSAPGAGRDWGDIAVVNGTLVDFDSRPTAPNYFHQDLYTKAVTSYTPAAVDAPRQAAVDWNNVIYNIGGSANSFVVGGVTIATGTIATYNGNGTINTASIDTIKHNGVAELGSWGDAGEAFKPRVDYGDAPASYDPVTGDPAVHETSKKLYLGTNTDDEWATRGQTALANSDNYDDGMVLGSLVNPSTGSFFCTVKYFNNTGSTATICAWVDFNGNGKFDASEGLTKTLLPSSASTQSVFMSWTGISSSLVAGSYTYVRVRITSTANAMTTANATGYYDIGEVEDHRLLVTSNPLATQLVSFDATKKAASVDVSWEVTNEESGLEYVVQRSSDGTVWTDINTLSAASAKVANFYRFTDSHPLNGLSYYRLKMSNTAVVYSTVQKVNFGQPLTLKLSPNPAVNQASLLIQAQMKSTAQIRVCNNAGRILLSQTAELRAGSNAVPLLTFGLPSGFYWVQVDANGERMTEKLIVER